MKMKTSHLLLISSALALSITAKAADHVVNAVGVKFDPPFLVVEAGDSVNFTNMAGHLIETIDTMVPEGQEKILTDMGADVSITLNTEGVFAYKCTPHWGARMGGIILVGNPEDPQSTIDAYLSSIETNPENLPAKGLLKKFTKFLQENGKI